MSKYKYYYISYNHKVKFLGDYDYCTHAQEDDPMCDSALLCEISELKEIYNQLKEIFKDE